MGPQRNILSRGPVLFATQLDAQFLNYTVAAKLQGLFFLPQDINEQFWNMRNLVCKDRSSTLQ